MLNMFALILAIFTLISGIFWIVKYVKITACCMRRYTFFNKICIFHMDDIKKSRIQLLLRNKFFIAITNFIFEFCVSIFPILFFVFIVRSFVVEPFQIPSGSMMPTLLIGDFILVNKFCYGIKNPINQNLLIQVSSPKRGDLVVFKYPHNTKLDYIKRVIGVPGDRVVYNSRTKQLMIYPNFIREDSYVCIPLIITYTNIFLSDFVQIFNVAKSGEITSNFYQMPLKEKYDNGIRLIQSQESFDGIYHNILTITEPGSYNVPYKNYKEEYLSDCLSEWIVPKDQYFMLGDNRDNSADSRYWGFVPEKNIVGKAIVIWMSLDRQDSKWPILVRFNRIGRIF